MIIYNTTGNSTDAKGQEQLNSTSTAPSSLSNYTVPEPNAKQLPPASSSSLSSEEKERSSNSSNSNVTMSSATKANASDYYSSKVKIIIEPGAALKADSAFNPDIAHLWEGGEVIWINADFVTHTITSGKGFSDPEMGKHFDSGLMGSSYKKKLDKAGEYPYFCQVHPQMVGKIIVKKQS
jgi:plastocyanin